MDPGVWRGEVLAQSPLVFELVGLLEIGEELRAKNSLIRHHRLENVLGVLSAIRKFGRVAVWGRGEAGLECSVLPVIRPFRTTSTANKWRTRWMLRSSFLFLAVRAERGGRAPGAGTL